MNRMARLGLALALLALASPAVSGPSALLPYCWDLDNTACSPLGQTQNCQDGIWSDYVCVCRQVGSVYRWDCPEVR